MYLGFGPVSPGSGANQGFGAVYQGPVFPNFGEFVKFAPAVGLYFLDTKALEKKILNRLQTYLSYLIESS